MFTKLCCVYVKSVVNQGKDALFSQNYLPLLPFPVFLHLHLLLVILADIVVNPLGETQFLIDIAGAGFVGRGADGEILLRLPYYRTDVSDEQAELDD